MNYELMKNTNTAHKIIEYIREKGQATANELVGFLMISERAVFKQLSNLIAKDRLAKIGKPPKVFYLLSETRKETVEIEIPKVLKKIIDKNFLIITPSGERKEGSGGFFYWCQKTKQPLLKMAEVYGKTFREYERFRKNGFINGNQKMKSTFKDVYLDEVFYLDFYALPIFGKTKLGQLLLYAKQSQDKFLMKELFERIKPRIEYLVKRYKIDGIGFIPPTVKRKAQFMKEMEKNIYFNARKINIVKAKTEISVPQKTLNKLEDRVENASKTIIIDDLGNYKNILLIDDAVGSGATLNETAAQIRRRNICQGKIIGLSITGSLKGFDVISEV